LRKRALGKKLEAVLVLEEYGLNNAVNRVALADGPKPLHVQERDGSPHELPGKE
jgi:hypothetical protein